MKSIKINSLFIELGYSESENYYDFVVKNEHGEHLADFHYRFEAYCYAKKFKGE